MGSSFNVHAGTIGKITYFQWALGCGEFNGATIDIDSTLRCAKAKNNFGVWRSGSCIRFGAHGLKAYCITPTSGCPIGEELNANGVCEAPPVSCGEHKNKFAHNYTWDYYALGDRPTNFCTEQCQTEMGITNYKCDLKTAKCHADLYYTGEACSGETSPGGLIPDRPFTGCEIHPLDPTQGYFCPKDNDGDGKPDAGAELDPDAYCKYDIALAFSCKGGTYDKPFEPEDPTKPITPPSGGGEIVDPNTPPIDVETEPDVENPTPAEDGSNSDVVSAITNQNRDLNKMLRGLNVDNNTNFAKVNRHLDMLNQRQQQTSDNIVSQMRQDIDIYNNQKAMQRQMHSDVVGALQNNGENQLKELGDIGNRVTQSGDKVTDAINKLADKVGDEACVPTAENKYCENPHGLSSDFSKDAYTQMLDVADSQLSAANSTLLSHVTDAVNKPMTDEAQGYIDKSISDLVGVMPSSEECEDLVLKTELGQFSLGCEFSNRLKSILSFVIYVYTLMTLSEILLNGVTPAAGTTPYSSRR